MKESVVYQATVLTEEHNPPQIHVGKRKILLKLDMQFTNANKRHNTELIKYIWYLKENLAKFKVTWRIFKHATSYNPVSGGSRI